MTAGTHTEGRGGWQGPVGEGGRGGSEESRLLGPAVVTLHAVGITPNGEEIRSDDPSSLPQFDVTSLRVDASPDVRGHLSATLFIDKNLNHLIDAGDSIAYTAVVTNVGNQIATEVSFKASPPSISSLVLGRTRSSLGRVVSGNMYDGEEREKDVIVAVGQLEGGGEFAEITFVVEVNEVLDQLNANGELCTQGEISFAESKKSVVTDDPSTAVWDDPTCSLISASPLLVVTQTSNLYVDYDWDDRVDPGDVIRYTITLRNEGPLTDRNVRLEEILDRRTLLQKGSVTTSQGSVVSGNRFGDDRVIVDIGFVMGKSSEIIVTFDVKVVTPFPFDGREVKNQAVVTSDTFDNQKRPAVLSTDPMSLVLDYPTVTPIDASPVLSLSASRSLLTSSQTRRVLAREESVRPGDLLETEIVLSNSGNQDAENVTLILYLSISESLQYEYASEWRDVTTTYTLSISPSSLSLPSLSPSFPPPCPRPSSISRRKRDHPFDIPLARHHHSLLLCSLSPLTRKGGDRR